MVIQDMKAYLGGGVGSAIGRGPRLLTPRPLSGPGLHCCCYPKVRQHDVSFLIDQHILPLDVSVNEAPWVHVVET